MLYSLLAGRRTALAGVPADRTRDECDHRCGAVCFRYAAAIAHKYRFLTVQDLDTHDS